MRRRSKVNKQLQKQQPPSKKNQLTKELIEIELKLQDSFEKSHSAQEQKAIEAIKKNPKYFFTYIKKFSKTPPSIGPLLNEQKQYAVDSEEMANILSKQYSSVFSTPRVTLQDAKSFFDDTETENSLHNIVFAEDDIIAAIDELSNNSAAGPDGFPAVMLKKLKHVLAKPLLAIWRQSLDEGICPNQAKQSTITPLHKGKSTAHAANYRPVTLTSHLVKIFEKVLRKHVVSHLEKNNLFNNTQHGFRAGRSCLSQLLSHYDNPLSP